MDRISPENLNLALEIFKKYRSEMAKIIQGQEDLILGLWLALSTGGHILLEGVPGLAKTLAVKTLAQVLGLDFQRIQFTPDLLPGDLIGTAIFQPQKGDFQFKKGPIFTQILLADEINRAPAKVQSALLEAMEERQITQNDATLPLPKPFFVLATQNPIEQEGTYPLPEAQLDRFFLKVLVTYPQKEAELAMLRARSEAMVSPPVINRVATQDEILKLQKWVHQIYLDPALEPYILALVRATRNPQEYGLGEYQNYVQCGASPRAVLALALAAKGRALSQGRDYVNLEDLAQSAFPVLRHRIILTYEAAADRFTSEDLIGGILARVEAP